MRGALVLMPLLLVAIAAALMIGEVNLGLDTLWQGLVSGEGPGAFTLRVLRGPRVGTALGAGALLGLSGAVFQILLRNPLAAPDVMGFNSGAGLAIVIAVTVGLGAPMPLLAAAGGVATAILVGLLSFRRGHAISTLTLILVGIGVHFATQAIGSFLTLRLPVEQATEAQRWLAGSLSARDWGHVTQVWTIGALLCVALAAQVRNLQLLELGRDLAAGLGTRVDLSRLGLFGTGVLLAATAVAVAGPVSFVALMAAPLGSRLINARSAAGRLVGAAGAGALIMVLADLCARAALPGVQLPIGVMTGMLGAPYLLWRLAVEMDKGQL